MKRLAVLFIGVFVATACGGNEGISATGPPAGTAATAPTPATTEVTETTWPAMSTAQPTRTIENPPAPAATPASGGEQVRVESNDPAARGLGDVTRLCTVGVEFDEVLNVRSGPSLDGAVVAGAPGGSCAMVVDSAADLEADWLRIVYHDGHVRHDGFVHSDFAAPMPDDIVVRVLAWVQAVLDGTDRAPFEYGPDLARYDTAPIEAYAGGVAIPYRDTNGGTCRLDGDITVICGVQVNQIVPETGEQRVGHFVISATRLGTNGYGEEYFGPDFGDKPLVIGYDACASFHACAGFDFGTIAIDSDASLAGVPLGTEAAVALAQLESVLGSPAADTGWVPGCALDGDASNERYVEWGNVTVALVRSEEVPDGEFYFWQYDLDGEVGESELTSRIRLPGGLIGGDSTLSKVSERSRLPVEIDELLQEPVIFGPGWSLYGEQLADGQYHLTRAAVPFIAICD